MEQAARRFGDGSVRPEATRAIPLALSRLCLVNFRSYTRAEVRPGAGPIVLYGPNGSGKTNCLEAISFLSPGRGLRGAKLTDVQRKGPVEALSAWGVAATLMRSGDAFELGTDITPAPAGSTARRVMRLNSAAAPAAEFAELAPMLWLSPAQDRLFLEGASERRRFLDRLVFGLDAGHARRAARYERAMRERLKLLREGFADPAWLDGLEETMAETGSAITEARMRIVGLLNDEIAARGKQSRFPAAHLALAGADEDGDRDALAARFRRTRRLDGESGRTNTGPHLTDLEVRHTGKQAHARDCSTGEQKALLISILLANAWLQKRKNDGVSPFLLLDEVAAHLDAERRDSLFEEILNLAAQAWMTGTDRELFAPLEGAASLFTVADGQFVPQDQT